MIVCHRAISFILFWGKVFILQSTGSIELFFLKYQKLHPDFLSYFGVLPFLDVEYYGAAEPPVRCGESHLSGLTEPPHFVY